MVTISVRNTVYGAVQPESLFGQCVAPKAEALLHKLRIGKSKENYERKVTIAQIGRSG